MVLAAAGDVESGVLPSRTLPCLGAALRMNPPTPQAFWEAVAGGADVGVARLFAGLRDHHAVMEPAEDGLVLIDLSRRLVRSFQRYMPFILPQSRLFATAAVVAQPTNAAATAGNAGATAGPVTTDCRTTVELPAGWSLIDHYFS